MREDPSSMSSGIANLEPIARREEQKAWSWYDWANSAYFTTIGTVFFGPWMIHIAKAASTNCVGQGKDCIETVPFLGLNLAAGGLPGYIVAAATVVSAILLPIIGAMVDRSSAKKTWLAGFAYSGALTAALLFFLDGKNWQIGAFALFASNILMGSSLVVYNAILVDISTSDERDAASSRGWAWGYLGGGLLLLINLIVYTFHAKLGLSAGLAVRLCMLSAAVWWGAFTIIPVRRLRNYAPRAVEQIEGGVWERSFGQLWRTLKDMRNYPQTLLFLVAYVFFNDGIQTVINNAAVYGSEALKLGQTVLTATILLVQFVAFGGALFFGKLAQKRGAYDSILYGILGWIGIVVIAYFLPAKNVAFFLALGVGIAVVMGGTQALARSFFSLLIPHGREGEYFSLYQMFERGTSWLGSLMFSLVYQMTGSFRYAILGLITFFVIGGLLLWKMDPEEGIREAGNALPSVV